MFWETSIKNWENSSKEFVKDKIAETTIIMQIIRNERTKQRCSKRAGLHRLKPNFSHEVSKKEERAWKQAFTLGKNRHENISNNRKNNDLETKDVHQTKRAQTATMWQECTFVVCLHIFLLSPQKSKPLVQICWLLIRTIFFQ